MFIRLYEAIRLFALSFLFPQMEPITFRFSSGNLEYSGPVNIQTHSYLQLLRTI